MSIAEKFHDYVAFPQNCDIANVTKVKDRLMQLLKALTEYLKPPENRDTLPPHIFHDIQTVVCRLSHNIVTKVKEETAKKKPALSDDVMHMVELSTESFRSLRNSCAGCKRNQEEVLKTPGLYWIASNILHSLVTAPRNLVHGNQAVVQCLRCGVQFLGNAVAGFEESKIIVWQAIFNIIRPLLKAEDATLANYTCMLIYTCLTAQNVIDLVDTPNGIKIVASVLQHLSRHDTEWGMFILEKLLAQSQFMSKGYDILDISERLILVDFLSAKVKTMEDKSDKRNGAGKDVSTGIRSVSSENVAYISTQFKTKASKVVGALTRQSPDKEALLSTKLLEVLCSATGLPTLSKTLQADKELLQCALELLQAVHKEGSKPGSMFAPISRLSEQGSVPTGNHPAHGFKRDLIRLIANMTYQNQTNQDLVREMACIPIILDNTQIDEKNPYITQWSIFAIRNLCENNTQNQSIISELKPEGIPSPSQLNLGDATPPDSKRQKYEGSPAASKKPSTPR